MKYLKPSEIYYSQDSISNTFDTRCQHSSYSIGETLDEICEGRCDVDDIPTISVVNLNGKWTTRDNRRLWVFRHLERLGICHEVPVTVAYSIPEAKLTAYNGGRDIRVRRNPGGYWYTRKPKARTASIITVPSRQRIYDTNPSVSNIYKHQNNRDFDNILQSNRTALYNQQNITRQGSGYHTSLTTGEYGVSNLAPSSNVGCGRSVIASSSSSGRQSLLSTTASSTRSAGVNKPVPTSYVDSGRSDRQSLPSTTASSTRSAGVNKPVPTSYADSGRSDRQSLRSTTTYNASSNGRSFEQRPYEYHRVDMSDYENDDHERKQRCCTIL